MNGREAYARLRKRLAWIAAMDGCARSLARTLPAVAAALVALVVAMLIDAKWPLAGWTRLAISAMVVSAAAWMVWGVARTLVVARGRMRALERGARLVEVACGAEDSRVINALQLGSAAAWVDARAQGLVGRIVERGAEMANAARARDVVAWRPALRGAVMLGAALVIAGGIGVGAARVARLGWARFVAPLADVPEFTWTDFVMDVVAPDEPVIGDDVRVRVRTSGREVPDALWLSLRGEAGDAGAPAPMERVEGARGERWFVTTLRDVRTPARFCVLGETGRSGWFVVTPEARPRVTLATARIVGGAEQELRLHAGATGRSAIGAPAGAVVELRMECTLALQRVDGAGDEHEAFVEGSTAVVRVRAREGDAARLSLKAVGEAGLAARELLRVDVHGLAAVEDADAAMSESEGARVTLLRAPAPSGGAPVADAGSERGQREAREGEGRSTGAEARRDARAEGSEQEEGRGSGVGGAGVRGRQGMTAGRAVEGDAGAMEGAGALRGRDVESEIEREGTGAEARMSSKLDETALAQVPEAYREVVTRYFRIVEERAAAAGRRP